MNSGNYQYINTATTTIIGAQTVNGIAATRRIQCLGIFINKTTTGTVTIKSGATTIGVFAIGTVPNTYWLTDDGVEIADMQVVTSAGDDVTVAYNNL